MTTTSEGPVLLDGLPIPGTWDVCYRPDVDEPVSPLEAVRDDGASVFYRINEHVGLPAVMTVKASLPAYTDVDHRICDEVNQMRRDALAALRDVTTNEIEFTWSALGNQVTSSLRIVRTGLSSSSEEGARW